MSNDLERDTRKVMIKLFWKSALWIGVITTKYFFISITLVVVALIAGMVATGGSGNLWGDEVREGVVCSVTGEIDQSAWVKAFERAGALQEAGDMIVELSNEFGVDPVLFASIVFHETGWGASRAIILYNNPGGLMSQEGLMRFETLNDGLRATARTLHNLIIERGNYTLEQLRDVYAPLGAENDPLGLNNHWLSGVESIISMLGGLTMNCERPNLVEGESEFIVPIENPVVSSWFGPRRNPFGLGYHFHTGIDFAHPVGTPIMASKSGRVVIVRFSNVGYGNMIKIDHADGTWTLYAHMDSIYVTQNQVVRQGEIIGTVGNTGASTGPHLHFEIRTQFDGGFIDPRPLLGF